MSKETFATFSEFYPYYLSEHEHPVCRRLHYVGTSLAAAFLAYSLVSLQPAFAVVGFVCGYALAWVGHFLFERNKPATFQYPFWSFIGDWVMLKDALASRTARARRKA